MNRAILLSVALVAGCASAAEPSGQPDPASPGVVEIVVANQQSASASLLSEDGTSSKHVQVGTGPHEAAVSPDGRTAVATIYGTQPAGNKLAVIDLVGDSVIRTIDLGQYTRPHGAVFLGNSNTRLVVTSESTRNVVLVDISTGSVEAIATNAAGSHMIAVNAAGTRGWTANVGANSVSEIDLVGKTLVRSIAVPAQPEGITVTPNGADVWVGSNATGAVTVISTATGQVSHTLTGATFPYRLGASPDGTRIAVVDGQGNKLMIADAATHAYIGSIPLDSPRGVAIGANNRTAYVTLAAGLLAVVDIRDLKLIRTIPVQSSPDGVGVGIRR